MAIGGIGKLRKWVKQINNIPYRGYILQAISFFNSVFQKIHRKQFMWFTPYFFTDS